MQGIALGQYLPAESPVHRLDPRTKILAVLVSMPGVFMSGREGLAVMAALAAAGLVLSRLPLVVLWGQFRSLGLIILLTALFQALFIPGEALFVLGPVSASYAGLAAGLDLMVRLVLVIALGIVLTSTTSAMSLAAGLEDLLKPLARLGLPVHEAAMAVTIAVRFVPLITGEAGTIASAQASRGAGFGGPGLARRMSAVVSLMVPLLVGAFRRSEELATAMEARCYRGGHGRTRMHPLKFTARDAVCLIICAAALVAALALGSPALSGQGGL